MTTRFKPASPEELLRRGVGKKPEAPKQTPNVREKRGDKKEITKSSNW